MRNPFKNQVKNQALGIPQSLSNKHREETLQGLQGLAEQVREQTGIVLMMGNQDAQRSQLVTAPEPPWNCEFRNAARTLLEDVLDEEGVQVDDMAAVRREPGEVGAWVRVWVWIDDPNATTHPPEDWEDWEPETSWEDPR